MRTYLNNFSKRFKNSIRIKKKYLNSFFFNTFIRILYKTDRVTHEVQITVKMFRPNDHLAHPIARLLIYICNYVIIV